MPWSGQTLSWQARPLIAGYLLGFSLACALWLSAAFVEPMGWRIACVVIALAMDYGTPFLLLLPERLMVRVHPEHMLERFFGITQMAFAGCIFMFVGNITQQTGASVGAVLQVGVLGILIVYPFQLVSTIFDFLYLSLLP